MRRTPYFVFAFVIAVAISLSACHEKPAPRPVAKPAVTNIYSVKGIVLELLAGGDVQIKHEEIPGYMEAMTMPFSVKNTNELRGLLPGMTVSFRLLVVPGEESWIDRITQLGGAKQTEVPSVQSFRRVRDVEELKVGDMMPDYTFTNQVGQAVKLSQFKGQALAFTFIFTRCPLPDFCPRMSKNFSETQRQLTASGLTNWHLMTISFDPAFDTPAVLKFHSQFHGADPARWDFVTGAMIDIDAITEQFGLAFSREAGSVMFNHKLRTVVIDARGMVQTNLIGNQWKPEDLVAEMTRAAAVK